MKKFLAKSLSIGLSLTLAAPSFAYNSVDSKVVVVQNNDVSEFVTLNTQTTRTAYRTETVPSTCTREVLDHYERVCDYGFVGTNKYSEVLSLVTPQNNPPERRPGDNHGQNPRPTPTNPPERRPGDNHGQDPRPTPRPEPRPEPRPNPRPEPRPEPRPNPRPEPRPEPRPNPRPEPRPEPRPNPYPYPTPYPTPYPRPEPRPVPRCYDRPVYRTEVYSCMKDITVAYEVVDHNTVANINAHVSKAPSTRPQTTNCGIEFTLNGDSLAPANLCDDYLAVIKDMSANERRVNDTLVKDVNYDIELYDLQTIFAPLSGGLQNMHIEGDEVVFQTGNLMGATNYIFKLYVERRRFLQSDKVLVDRVLNPNEFLYQPVTDSLGNTRINLRRILGNFESDRKHIIKIQLEVNMVKGNVLYTRTLPNLHQENSITINN